MLHALMGQSRTDSARCGAALAHHLARWQPALLLGLALLLGGLLRFPGLYDRLEPIHRESELVILAYTRAPDDWLCTAFAAIGLCSASVSPTAPQTVESYGPGEPRAGPAVVWRRLVGVGPGAVERGRLASAIAGLATIVASWWAARVLAGPPRGQCRGLCLRHRAARRHSQPPGSAGFDRHSLSRARHRLRRARLSAAT